MSILKYIVPIGQAVELVEKVLKEDFDIDEGIAKKLALNSKGHFDCLLDSCYILAETSYVDKVYRDSYYTYFSSKLVRYKRHCVRLSIFESKIDIADFTNAKCKEKVESLYRGFLILRPTEPQIIGRSLISPRALKNNNFLTCLTTINTTVNSVKVSCEGFPHSSQDGETITCAETTIWALMEYFGSKYPEYKPILPSTIIKQLNALSYERQIPSKGLNVQQMSFALKEFGFAPRIYARGEYDEQFDNLLSIYIESGIPVILGVDNFSTGGSIGHALLNIGRHKINSAEIDKITYKNFGKLKISYWDDIATEYVFIDDNFPAYQTGKLSEPFNYYKNADWASCKINHFIAPLYPKIYLEAFEAKSYVNAFLTSALSPVESNTELLIRLFLTSSRSFKHHIALYGGLQEDVRDMILETSMPKFIWIAELSNKDDIKMQKANGILIIDATEANLSYNYPMLFAMYKETVLTPNFNNNTLEKKSVPLSPFLIYEQNLKFA